MKFVDLAAKALRTIGAIGQGVGMSANDLQVAFEAAADMFDAWAAERLTIYQTLRAVYPLVANKGSTTNPYTIGVGGDFDTARPIWIPNAKMRVLTTTPAFEIDLHVLEPDEYAGISIKDLSSALAQALYFDGKWDTSGVDVGLGNIFLYPVPNGQQPIELALYLPRAMPGFADTATTDYSFPPGYAEALRYQLAKRLAIEFGKAMSPENQQLTIDTFAVIKKDNVAIPTLYCDYGIPGTNSAGGLYNWRTGTNTRRGWR